MPSQLPHARLAQVAPHTPPRRERDSDDQPPPPGALTPHQVGQLSRMLGLFSGPGQPQLTAEQLFAYLRGVQNKWVFFKQPLLNGNLHKLQFENSGIIITTYILIEPKNLCWSLVKWWRFSSCAMWDSYFLQRKIMSGTLLVVIHSQEGQSKTFFSDFNF